MEVAIVLAVLWSRYGRMERSWWICEYQDLDKADNIWSEKEMCFSAMKQDYEQNELCQVSRSVLHASCLEKFSFWEPVALMRWLWSRYLQFTVDICSSVYPGSSHQLIITVHCIIKPSGLSWWHNSWVLKLVMWLLWRLKCGTLTSLLSHHIMLMYICHLMTFGQDADWSVNMSRLLTPVTHLAS